VAEKNDEKISAGSLNAPSLPRSSRLKPATSHFRKPGPVPTECAVSRLSGTVAGLARRETDLHDWQHRVLPVWHSIFINTFFPNQFK
jgi:hypothetical protein